MTTRLLLTVDRDMRSRFSKLRCPRIDASVRRRNLPNLSKIVQTPMLQIEEPPEHA